MFTTRIADLIYWRFIYLFRLFICFLCPLCGLEKTSCLLLFALTAFLLFTRPCRLALNKLLFEQLRAWLLATTTKRLLDHLVVSSAF